MHQVVHRILGSLEHGCLGAAFGCGRGGTDSVGGGEVLNSELLSNFRGQQRDLVGHP